MVTVKTFPEYIDKTALKDPFSGDLGSSLASERSGGIASSSRSVRIHCVFLVLTVNIST